MIDSFNSQIGNNNNIKTFFYCFLSNKKKLPIKIGEWNPFHNTMNTFVNLVTFLYIYKNILKKMISMFTYIQIPSCELQTENYFFQSTENSPTEKRLCLFLLDRS